MHSSPVTTIISKNIYNNDEKVLRNDIEYINKFFNSNIKIKYLNEISIFATDTQCRYQLWQYVSILNIIDTIRKKTCNIEYI